MKILIIGGTGIISSEVCYKALDNGDDVYILNRGKRKKMIDNRAKIIIGDIRNDEILNLKSKISNLKFDVIIDFLVLNVVDLKRHIDIFDNLCKQYIFISSATVFGGVTQGKVIDETFNKGNVAWEYSENKYICEEYLKNNKNTFNFKYTIVRPYVTYGKTRIPFGIIPDANYWTLVDRIINHHPVIIWNHGANLCTITHAKDFAVGIVGLCLNEYSYFEDFNITSGHAYTWMEILLELSDVLKIDPILIDMNINEIINYLPEFSGVLRGDKGKDMVFSNKKIKRVVPEFCESINFKQGISQTIKYFNDNPELKTIDYGWNGRIDWMIEEYAKQNNINIEKEKIKSASYHISKKKNKIIYFINRHKLTRDLKNIFHKL